MTRAASTLFFHSLRHLRRFTSTSKIANMAPIERITLFNVPKEEDRKRLLEQYKVLAKTATKVCDLPDCIKLLVQVGKEIY